MTGHLPHLVIRAGTDWPHSATIEIDGTPLRGCQRLELRMEAGHTLPVVVLEVIPFALDVDLPEVVLAALRATSDEPAVDPEGHSAHLRAPDTMLSRLVDRMSGVDFDTLPDRYIALPIRNRLAILRGLHLISSRDAERALEDEPHMAQLDEAAFEGAAKSGHSREFAALVQAHTDDVAKKAASATAATAEDGP